MALSKMTPTERRILQKQIEEGDNVHPMTRKFCLMYITKGKKTGYGTVSTPYGPVDAHRAVYYGHHANETPHDEVEISHRCHNKRCVRIDHLVAESHSENCQRKICHKKGTSGCLGHTGPPCIL